MAGGSRGFLSILAIILLAGGCVLSFFIVLSGGVGGTPIKNVWFLEAQTGGYGNSPSPGAAWTWNAICQFNGPVGGSTGTTSACRKASAAPPFDPRRNFGTSGTPLPDYFQSHGSFFYAMSKASWALFLVALLFGVLAFFSALLAPCSRLISFLASFMASIAMVIQAAACAVMTAWTVYGRNHFRQSGIASEIGRFAYGFAWGALVCWFLAMVLFCCGGVLGGKKKKDTTTDDDDNDMPREPKQRSGFFGRAKQEPTTVGVDGHTGVKDDYS